jgi:hypothetical protein
MKNIILLILVIIFVVIIIQFIIHKKVIIEGNEVEDSKITSLKSLLNLKGNTTDRDLMKEITRLHPFNAADYTDVNNIISSNTNDTHKINQLLTRFNIDIPYTLKNIYPNNVKNIDTSNTLYYIFTQGTYTFTGTGTVEYLLIGGGGAGGSSHGGGGGAGGVIRGSVNLVAGNTYTVTVGEGGILNANGSNNGSNSTFSGNNKNITAYGGGYGGGDNNGDAYALTPSNTIGSGGGGCGYHFTGGPGLTSSEQGKNGSSARTSPGGGGGGGGAGEPGVSNSKDDLNYLGKAGGNGTMAHSAILSAISTQMNNTWNSATNHNGTYYIAAGGGGGSWGYNGGAAYSYGAPGGKGGGGNGGMFNGFTVLPTPPVQNTGSGGGGGGSGNQPGTSGASGLVVIIVNYV